MNKNPKRTHTIPGVPRWYITPCSTGSSLERELQDDLGGPPEESFVLLLFVTPQYEMMSHMANRRGEGPPSGFNGRSLHSSRFPPFFQPADMASHSSLNSWPQALRGLLSPRWALPSVSALKQNFPAALSACIFFPALSEVLFCYLRCHFLENRSDKGHSLLEWKRTVIWQWDIPSLLYITNVDISSFKTESRDKNCMSNSIASSYFPKKKGAFTKLCLWLLLNFRVPLLERHSLHLFLLRKRLMKILNRHKRWWLQIASFGWSITICCGNFTQGH